MSRLQGTFQSSFREAFSSIQSNVGDTIVDLRELMQLNQNIINKQSEIKSLDYKLASKNDELDELIETITEFKSEYERIKSATSNNKKEKKRKLTADDLPKSNNNRYH